MAVISFLPLDLLATAANEARLDGVGEGVGAGRSEGRCGLRSSAYSNGPAGVILSTDAAALDSFIFAVWLVCRSGFARCLITSPLLTVNVTLPRVLIYLLKISSLCVHSCSGARSH